MRIAFIVTHSEVLGGAQIHVRDLATALRQMGHDAVVFSNVNGMLPGEVAERGVPFRGLRHLVRPIHPPRDLLAFCEILGGIRELRPDIISTHSSKAGILGRIVGRLLGIPTLFTAHGWGFTQLKTPTARWCYLAAERAAAPLATRIITVCDRDRETAIQKGVSKRDRFVTIHNAMPDVDEALRASPAASPPRLVMVARFAEPKDHSTLFRALSGVRDLEWRLELAGDGPLQPGAEDLAKSLDIGSRVAFLGYRGDIPQLLCQAQAFVLITKSEGFPRSILEAMRAGLPVVASDVGGVREAVSGGETGFLVPAGDVQVLRERLRRIIADGELRVRLGAAARSRYERRFSFPSLVARHVTLYEEIVSARTVLNQSGIAVR